MSTVAFRQYDVRGLVDEHLDAAFYERLGRAFATWMDREGQTSIVVGRDARESSGEFAGALIAGLVAGGRRVLDLGLVTTPMTIFGLNFLGAGASVSVTASHNPAEYNGAKLRCNGRPIFGEELQKLRAEFEAGDFVEGKGSVESFDVRGAYLDGICGRVRPARALKVVADAGNGTGGLVVEDALHRLGFEVEPLYCEVDGRFPNHHPDPTKLKNLADLKERVLATGADIGFGYDGDADRVTMLDETGQVHWPDRVLMVLAKRMLAQRPGGRVCFDVKCSQLLADLVRDLGGEAVMTMTGYPFMLEAMRDPKALVGAELSGHSYFGGDPLFDFDDGVYASARIAECFASDPRPVSEQLAELPKSVSTPEIRVRVPEERKFEVTAGLVQAFRDDSEVVDLVDIDGARAAYPEGWGLVRASNTEPNLVLVFEANDQAGLDKVKSRFASKLSSFPEVEGELEA
jgi:phosphomannomutase/phosphoglucomutase